MLLLSRREKRMGKEGVEGSLKRGQCPGSDHLGSHSPSLPTGGNGNSCLGVKQ